MIDDDAEDAMLTKQNTLLHYIICRMKLQQLITKSFSVFISFQSQNQSTISDYPILHFNKCDIILVKVNIFFSLPFAKSHFTNSSHFTRS